MPDLYSNSLSECVIAFDLDEKKFLFISPNIFDVLGHDIDSFYQNNKYPYEIIYADDRDKVTALCTKLDDGKGIELNYRVETAIGVIKWIHDKKSLFTDHQTGHKVLLSIIKVFLPETNDKPADILPQKSLEALIHNSEDLIWSLDKQRRYLYFNNAYRRKIFLDTGIIPKEGNQVYQGIDYKSELMPKWEANYNRAFNGEIFVDRSEGFDRLTNQIICFEIYFNPIYSSKGDITGIGCCARNITELHKTEKALIDQNQRLRHIASVTSHELRRPVASMLGLINIMDRENFFNPDNKEIIEHMLTVGNEIDEVIRLIIDKAFTAKLP
jgi:PAS domain-containing protein